MVDSSSCMSMACNTTVEGNVKACPACGKKMRTSKAIRAHGIAMLISGLVLLGMMGTVTVYLAPMLLHPNPGGTEGFTGTAEQGEQALWLFSVILLFGAFATLTGIFQISTGRRNRTATVLALVFAVGIALLARYVSQTFGV
jgi:uncharacterized membrane protein HdeD (DUF308 family)